MNARILLLLLATLLLSPSLLAQRAPAFPTPAPSVSSSFPVATARPAGVLRLAEAGGSEAAAWDASSGALFLGQNVESYHSISVAVDAEGGLHAAYEVYAHSDEGHPVYYAYCPPTPLSACDDPQTWQRVRLGELPDGFPFVQLLLTADGRPRVLFYDMTIEMPEFFIYGQSRFRYAECEAHCTTAPAWSVVELLATENGGDMWASTYNTRIFRLDAQGRPRFIYSDRTTSYYTGCDAACTQASSWWRIPMPDLDYADELEYSSLAFTPDGRPRILTTTLDAEYRSWLVYVSCENACTSPSDWSVSEPLMEVVTSSLDHHSWMLQTNADGNPRITVKMPGEPIVYGWCDGACSSRGSWRSYGVRFGEADGEYPTLVLDAQDRPRLAYQDWSSTGLGYAWCESGCEVDAQTAQWTYVLAEDDEVIDAEFPVNLLSGCIRQTWLTGYRPSIALDPAGNPRIGYDAEHLMECYKDIYNRPEYGTYVETKWWTTRFVFFPHPGGTGTPVEDEPAVPSQLVVEQNYPEPFNPSTTIPFTIRESGHVRLAVYDLLGREVAVLIDGPLGAGAHHVAWNAAGAPTGRYLYRLQAGGEVKTRAMTLLR